MIEAKRRALIPLQKRRFASGFFPIAFLLPSICFIGFVNIYPFVMGLVYSFRDGTLLDMGSAVGLSNYAKLFTMPDFWKALRFSLIFASVTVLGAYTMGLSIALLLDTNLPFRGVYRASLLIPWIVPSVVSVVCWRWMIVDRGSMINVLLGWFGIGPIYFLSDQTWRLSLFAS